VIDVRNLPADLTAADLQFRVGNDNNPAAWAAAPAPLSITTTRGAGASGADRVTILFADNVIQRQWLQVTLLAGVNTGIAQADVFYFGNAIGESGNNPANAAVDSSDELAARNNRTFLTPAALTNNYDYNRDGRVDSSDELIARSNRSGLTPLRLITAPIPAPAAPAIMVRSAPTASAPTAVAAEPASPIPPTLQIRPRATPKPVAAKPQTPQRPPAPATFSRTSSVKAVRQSVLNDGFVVSKPIVAATLVGAHRTKAFSN
jgi:hypothetical protein